MLKFTSADYGSPVYLSPTTPIRICQNLHGHTVIDQVIRIAGTFNSDYHTVAIVTESVDDVAKAFGVYY